MPSEEMLNLNFKEMKAAGLPVKQGIRQFHIEDKKDGRAIASGMWVHRWAKHAAMNYPVVSKGIGIREFEDCAKDLPTFCVGIGPSLDDNIKELKVAQNRSIIIATDSAIKPLLANGIIPHAAMTFDCREEQKTLFENIPIDIQSKIFLFVNSCSHPDTIDAWKGPKIFFNQYHQQDEFIAKLLPYIYQGIGQLPSAGTVGNMIVLLAHFLGSKAIHLVGMDLCYGAGEKQGKAGWQYRATDYVWTQREGQSWEKKDNIILYENESRVLRSFEEDINGNLYRVDPELKMYRESLVNICKAAGIFPIDCSTGVLNQFFPHRTVGECIMLHCRSEIPKFRTVLTNAEEFFGGYKITFNTSLTNAWPAIKNLSETFCKTATVRDGT